MGRCSTVFLGRDVPRLLTYSCNHVMTRLGTRMLHSNCGTNIAPCPSQHGHQAFTDTALEELLDNTKVHKSEYLRPAQAAALGMPLQHPKRRVSSQTGCFPSAPKSLRLSPRALSPTAAPDLAPQMCTPSPASLAAPPATSACSTHDYCSQDKCAPI